MYLFDNICGSHQPNHKYEIKFWILILISSHRLDVFFSFSEKTKLFQQLYAK